MGAEQFTHFAKGNSPDEAFSAARSEALYDYGHAGYTGTLAEKSEFTVIGTAKDRREADEMAENLFAARDPRIDDKWGPAGCITFGDDEYLFFGWASS